jgi:hypothetical protein
MMFADGNPTSFASLASSIFGEHAEGKFIQLPMQEVPAAAAMAAVVPAAAAVAAVAEENPTGHNKQGFYNLALDLLLPEDFGISPDSRFRACEVGFRFLFGHACCVRLCCVLCVRACWGTALLVMLPSGGDSLTPLPALLACAPQLFFVKPAPARP